MRKCAEEGVGWAVEKRFFSPYLFIFLQNSHKEKTRSVCIQDSSPDSALPIT